LDGNKWLCKKNIEEKIKHFPVYPKPPMVQYEVIYTVEISLIAPGSLYRNDIKWNFSSGYSKPNSNTLCLILISQAGKQENIFQMPQTR